MAAEKKAPAKKTEKKAAAPARAAASEAPASAKAAHVDPRNSLQKRAEIEGIVVSDKMQKTIVVKVDRRVRHSFFKKYVVRSNKYKAHDEKNEARIGDRVRLVESKPISKDKRWVLSAILRRAAQVAEVNA